MDAIRTFLLIHLKTAWKNRWLALAAAWLVCGAGWVMVTLIPNQYESSARLYVDADAVLTPLLHGLAAETAPSSQLEILQRTLLSRPNVDRLISKTDLDLSVGSSLDRERLITALADSIHVRSQARNLFTIDYRNKDPKLAYDVVQTLLTIFIESATGTNRSDMENARLFLQRQIASYEAQLREAERRRAEFRSKYVDLLPQGDGGSRLEAARQMVAQFHGLLVDATQRRDSLKQELANTPALVVVDPGDGAVGGGGTTGPGRLAEAQRQLADLRLRFTDQHPDVIALQKQIAAIKASPGGGAPEAAPGPRAVAGPHSKSAPNPVYDQLKVRLVDAEANVTSLQRQLDEATANQNRMEATARREPGLEAEYQNLDRDYNVLRHNYEELLSRREAANIAQAADTQADKVKLQVIDPPQVSRVAVSPNRLLLITGVFLAGIGGGGAIAFLLGQFDRSFRTIEDMRSLGLPVLGGISMLAAPIRRGTLIGTAIVCSGFIILGLVYGGLVFRTLRPGVLI
jgi:polysaccharide chain length determinant protein (PEP-CTERM system associated)